MLRCHAAHLLRELIAINAAVAVFVDPFEAPPQALELLRLLELLALLLAPRLLLGDLLINKRTHTAVAQH